MGHGLPLAAVEKPGGAGRPHAWSEDFAGFMWADSYGNGDDRFSPFKNFFGKNESYPVNFRIHSRAIRHRQVQPGFSGGFNGLWRMPSITKKERDGFAKQ